MKRFALSVIVLPFTLLSARHAGAQRPGEVITPDYVFVIDISRSMRGEGSGNPENIFPQVRQAVERFVANVDLGSNVVLVPFADGVKGFQRIPIRSATDRERALQMVRSLEATGNKTHVYGAVQEAFRRYTAFRAAEAGREKRMVWMLVYTDGRDNGPQGLTMAQIIDAFKLNRQEYDYLYYATLGAPLSGADIRAIEESGVATYVDNPRGEVAPLWIVYPRYSLIDFGNLSEGPRKRVVQSFGRIGSGEFPADFRMDVSADFPGIGEATQAEVDPYSAAPEREVPLRLRLINGIPRNGHYQGNLRFSSGPQQGVVVFPQQVRARFDYGPSPRVMVAGKLEMGRAAPHSGEPAERRAHATAALSLNAEARTRGGRFVAVLQPDPGNPAPLAPGTVRLNGRSADVDTVDVTRTRSISLEIDAARLLPGTYRGKVVLEDGSVKVDEPREISWKMEVAAPPTPLWVRAATLVVLGALAWWVVRRRRPVLRGRLIIQEPFDRVNTQVSLNGYRELSLTENGEVAREGGGHVRIVADGVGRNARPRVYKVVDGVYVRKARDGQNLAFQNTILDHGDELVWEGHRLTYNKN
jgi:hypothetical protein